MMCNKTAHVGQNYPLKKSAFLAELKYQNDIINYQNDILVWLVVSDVSWFFDDVFQFLLRRMMSDLSDSVVVFRRLPIKTRRSCLMSFTMF